MSEMKKQAGRMFNQLADAVETGRYGEARRVVLTTLGSELGPAELVRGAEIAVQHNPGLDVILIGQAAETRLEAIETDCEADAHRIMEQLLEKGEAHAAVTLHYNFPLGVATVGRILTPARGKPLLIATTTGATASDRVQAMAQNAIAGIAAAKATGIARPSLGIVNVDGARQVERILRTLKDNGYDFNFSQSMRSDGGAVFRGNDLLAPAADVVVCDTLTGNLLMKLFSAYTSGGTYETSGWGYGPGIGQSFCKVINIISRASGAPVVAGAIQYAAQCARGNLPQTAAEEYAAANKAGLKQLLQKSETKPQREEAAPPSPKPVTEEIAGIDILELEDAVKVLWAEEIYAETGMGCAGPVVMVAREDRDKAREIIREHGYL